MNSKAAIFGLFMTLSTLPLSTERYNKRCKWSNEDCLTDSDCCSEDCHRAHEGTDPRCTRGRVFMPCYADYQCENGLACGKTYECCAPYWGICSQTTQCCDSSHICREEEGFIYRRCLYPSVAIRTSPSNVFMLTILSSLTLLTCQNH